MVAAAIPIPEAKIAEICRRHGIARLEVFGSVLRDDFDPARSDVDLLVEFFPDRSPTYFTLSDIEDEFSAAFGGRKVDVVLRDSLSRWIRDAVLAAARPVYVAA
jgi:uncharacterized protein